MKSCLCCTRTHRPHLGAGRAAPSYYSAASHRIATPSRQGHSVRLGLLAWREEVFVSILVFSSLVCVFFFILERIWAWLERFIRGCTSLLHILLPLTSGFDITLLSPVPFLSAASSLLLHASTHPRLY